MKNFIVTVLVELNNEDECMGCVFLNFCSDYCNLSEHHIDTNENQLIRPKWCKLQQIETYR